MVYIELGRKFLPCNRTRTTAHTNILLLIFELMRDVFKVPGGNICYTRRTQLRLVVWRVVYFIHNLQLETIWRGDNPLRINCHITIALWFQSI